MRVVGVLKTKGANLMGQDQDDILLVPWTTIKYRIAGSRLQSANQNSSGKDSYLYPGGQSLYPEQSSIQAENSPMLVRFANIDAIMTAARSTSQVTAATEEITEILRAQHGISPGDSDDFEIIKITVLRYFPWPIFVRRISLLSILLSRPNLKNSHSKFH
ncbi:MAG: hypothetical protein U9N60_00155 [Thermodesulfobacteriota bacterium]|nr:hypothetical protein [Thermodesulfobacteriota bacterium]